MTIRTVLFWPAQALRETAEEVSPEELETTEFHELVEDLKETMQAYRAEGIAATQIGVLKRVLCIKDPNADAPLVLINPTIEEHEEEKVEANEGCLSFPGVKARIERYASVKIKALTQFGDEIELDLVGMRAVAIQHELDHLDGKVMLDYMGKLERKLAVKRVKKIQKKLERALL